MDISILKLHFFLDKTDVKLTKYEISMSVWNERKMCTEIQSALL